MARGATQTEDRPQERESPVRRTHAKAAKRHGRASTPGYLGLPADDEPDSGATGSASEEGEEAAEPDTGATGSASGESEEEPGRSRSQRAPRARARASSSAGEGADSSSGGESADSPDERRQSGQGKRQQGDRPRNSPKGRTKGSTPKAATARRTTSEGRKGGGKQSARQRKHPAQSRAPQGAGKRRTKAAAQSIKSKAASTGRRAEGEIKSKAASTGRRAKGEIGKRVARGTLRIAGALAKRAAVAASRRAGKALTRAGERGIDGVIERAHRLPIQQSIDVAVPPEIAWEQWMELRHLPEGTHRLTEVERDGDELNGMLDGLRARSWSAEVIDERDQESFAWRSTEGSDSAGLVTFHPLGERLTRIEVTIDAVPEGLGEAARLMLHIADRRVEEELRRFKADAELLNPDVYEELLASAGDDGSRGDEDG